MTTKQAAAPAPETRLVRRNYGRNHGYKIDGVKALGVTTALNVLEKRALIQWAANQAAELAVNEWDRLAELPIATRLKELQTAHRKTVNTAAVRGTDIHGYGEKLLNGEEVQVPDELRGPVEAYARWLDQWKIEPIASETPLCHTEYGFAGTADLWGRVGVRDNAVALLDIKTGKGVYDETALQLAAYRYSNLMQPEKGVEIATPEVELVYVAHILPDAVRTLPVVADEQTFRTFLYVLQVAKAKASWDEWPLIGSAVQHDRADDDL